MRHVASTRRPSLEGSRLSLICTYPGRRNEAQSAATKKAIKIATQAGFVAVAIAKTAGDLVEPASKLAQAHDQSGLAMHSFHSSTPQTLAEGASSSPRPQKNRPAWSRGQVERRGLHGEAEKAEGEDRAASFLPAFEGPSIVLHWRKSSWLNRVMQQVRDLGVLAAHGGGRRSRLQCAVIGYSGGLHF